MTLELLAAKLTPPRLRAGFVSRPRLVQRVANPRRGHVTLIAAPAGYGKTTLLAEFYQVQKGDIAWVTIDEEDNDPAVFWEYVATALGVKTLGIWQDPKSRVDALLNELAAQRENKILVLDDLHGIESKTVLKDLARFIEYAPQRVSFVLASRRTPQLPLARWRARGQLNEIGTGQMAFTRGEARDLLQKTMQLEMDGDALARLEKLTQGWAAALQLAALSLRGESSAVNGEIARAHIFEYFAGEVLRKQSRLIQRFLMEIAVLERISRELADAATGRTDSGELLAELVRANLFISAMDAEQRWFRFHPLFAEFLQKRLLETDPEGMRTIHERAGDWLAARGLYVEAIRHAMRAGNFRQAGVWVEMACDEAMQHGQLATMRRWLEALPTKVIAENVGLNVWYGWVLALQGDFDGMDARLTIGEKRAKQLARKSLFWRREAEHARGKMAAIRTQAAVMQEDGRNTLRWSQRALALLPKRLYRERAVVWLNRARALEGLGRGDEAEEAYAQAERMSHAASHAFIQLGVMTTHAEMLMRRGKVREAEKLTERARELARVHDVEGFEETAEALAAQLERVRERGKTIQPLSAREQEILGWLARGETNPQIADRLGIGVGTVNWHTKNIYKKLGARNRTEAVMIGVPRGR